MYVDIRRVCHSIGHNEQVLPQVGKFITSSPGLLKLNIY